MNATDHYRPVSKWPAKLRPAADFLSDAYALLRYGGKKHPEKAKRDALALAAHLSDYWRVKELGEAINVATGRGQSSPRSNVITGPPPEGLDGLGLFKRDPPPGRNVPFRIVLTPKGEEVVAASRPPEILEVEDLASGYTRRSLAQGLRLSPKERHAVEMHAMALAEEYLEKELGWRVRDVHLTHSYDFECTRGSEALIVEVKGTTSTGERIVITQKEVATHRARHPNNALIVVHSINLTRGSDDPEVDGGELLMCYPWKIDDDKLRPLAYQYSIRGDKLAGRLGGSGSA
jgi:hypothetical protein